MGRAFDVVKAMIVTQFLAVGQIATEAVSVLFRVHHDENKGKRIWKSGSLMKMGAE